VRRQLDDLPIIRFGLVSRWTRGEPRGIISAIIHGGKMTTRMRSLITLGGLSLLLCFALASNAPESGAPAASAPSSGYTGDARYLTRCDVGPDDGQDFTVEQGDACAFVARNLTGSGALAYAHKACDLDNAGGCMVACEHAADPSLAYDTAACGKLRNLRTDLFTDAINGLLARGSAMPDDVRMDFDSLFRARVAQAQSAPNVGETTAQPTGDSVPVPAATDTAQAADDCTTACDQQCAYVRGECQGGSTASCYRAASCLCACNLAHGGCGSAPDALEQCVRENDEKAASMAGGGPVIGSGPPAPTNTVAPPPPPPPAACPPGYRDCGVDHGHHVCLNPGSTACPAF
jgi:hypothetical protein